MNKRPAIFYGWVLVGVIFVGMLLIYGVRHSFSVFFPAIIDEFGWRRGDTALMLSINLLVYGITAPFAGTLADRWKPRLVVTAGIIIIAISTAACSLALELWHFYLLYGVVLPIGMALCGQPVLSPTLANWFHTRRGLALGLGQMGGGLSFSYGLFVERIIEAAGWRYAYVVLAAVLLIVTLPLFAIFFRYRPGDKGLKAYETGESPASREATLHPTVPRYPSKPQQTLRSALKSHRLWLMILAYLLGWGLSGYLLVAHQVKFAEDMGYSSIFAATTVAIYGIASVLGLPSASLSDRIGREVTATIGLALTITAVIALLLVHDASKPWLLIIFSISLGYGTGLFTPTVLAGIADVFHGPYFGTLAGLYIMGAGLGGAVGPWLGGYIYDVTGSYTGAFILCIACYATGCILFWIASPSRAAPRKSGNT